MSHWELHSILLIEVRSAQHCSMVRFRGPWFNLSCRPLLCLLLTVPTSASVSSSEKWGNNSPYILGMLLKTYDMNYIHNLEEFLAHNAMKVLLFMHLCVFAKQSIWKTKVDSMSSGKSVATEKMPSWFQKVFFFFQSHIARPGEEGFVVFIDSKALNLHTEI